MRLIKDYLIICFIAGHSSFHCKNRPFNGPLTSETVPFRAEGGVHWTKKNQNCRKVAIHSSMMLNGKEHFNGNFVMHFTSTAECDATEEASEEGRQSVHVLMLHFY